MKKTPITIFTSGIIVLNFILTTALSLYSLNTLIDENNRENSIIIANEVTTALNSAFAEPRSISMAIDNTFTREILENLEKYNGKEQAFAIGDYLYDYIKHFDYSTAFLVVAETLDYFTEWGFIKTLDLNNPDDDWFERFKDSGYDYQLNVDNDQANDNRLTIFINNRIEDDHGNFLAACGVGVLLDRVEKMIQNFEKQSKINIQLLSPDGIIQLSGDKRLQQRFAEKEYLDMLDEFNLSDEYLYQEKGKHGYSIMTYIPDCKWYLVIDHDGNNDVYANLLSKNLLICFIAFVVMIFAVYIVLEILQEKSDHYKINSETDRLTGLPNRRAYEEALNQIRKSNNLSLFSVMSIDINGLKNVNDTFGHNIGDELIKGIAGKINDFLHQHGVVFRIGGDEFVFITDEKIEVPEEMISILKKNVSSWKNDMITEASVSVGIARGNSDEASSIEELLEKADRKMYKDKAAYYQDSKHERRKR